MSQNILQNKFSEVKLKITNVNCLLLGTRSWTNAILVLQKRQSSHTNLPYYHTWTQEDHFRLGAHSKKKERLKNWPVIWGCLQTTTLYNSPQGIYEPPPSLSIHFPKIISIIQTKKIITNVFSRVLSIFLSTSNNCS